MNKNKLWCVCTLALLAGILMAAGVLTAAVDPFFHYHAPLAGLEYPIDNQRYQNDGIVKNFPYDALITGTSMTENFKTSELDALFGVHSVKVSYSGGTFEEVFGTVQRAIAANPDLKLVVFGMEEWFLFSGKEMILADGEYPTYLYDDNPFNDVEYLLNKEILCSNTLGVLAYTRSGQTTTDFDDYGSWDGLFPYDAGEVLRNYQRSPKADTTAELREDLVVRLTDTVQNTIVKTAKEHPDIQFLYFFPPYSILNWDSHSREGTLERQVQAFALASQQMLEADNIQLYSFYTDYDTVTDLNQYRDTVHYSGAVNSLLLKRMHDGEYRLTRDNYQAHWQEVLEFYRSYDYDALFAQE